MKKPFAKMKNGVIVYLNKDNPHLEAHKEDFSRLPFLDALKLAIRELSIEGDFYIGETNCGIRTGLTHCVEITEADEIVWLERAGRENKSKIVLNRKPEPTTYVTIGICRDRTDGKMTIFTAWAGPKAEKELTDPRLTEAERPVAEKFWANHALVL